VVAALTDSKGRYRLDPEDARDLLDATWGRHLADQLAGEENRGAIEQLANHRWARDARRFVCRHINPSLPHLASPTREQETVEIANRILKIETLQTRNSDEVDFHELAVWKISEALNAAQKPADRAQDGRERSMKTAGESCETHRDLHERFKSGKISARRFEQAIATMWSEIRAAGVECEVGELIKAGIRRAMAEARARLARGIAYPSAIGREITIRIDRETRWEVTTR
jgi:hypothetical protein